MGDGNNAIIHHQKNTAPKRRIFLKGPPQMPLSPHLEPKAQVVAFRAHQALPVGRAQQHR
jgi:hypothetical protein